MDKFLNSFAFEQMAREYNKKYGENKIKTLSLINDEYFEKDVTKVFDKVFCLFDLLKNVFKSNFNLTNFFKDVENLKSELKQTYKNLFFKEYNQEEKGSFKKNINHKLCSIEMLDIIQNIFLTEKMFVDKIFLSNEDEEQKEKDLFLFKDLQKIFEKIIKSFKDFYCKI